MEVFARRLRQLRTEAGEKQTDLQAALHCSQGMVSAYENGREPSFDTLLAIAAHYDTSTDYLLGMSAVKRHEAGDLHAIFDASAAAAEACGARPVSADDLQSLFEQLRVYADGNLPAGTCPLDVTHQLVRSMTALLSALNADSAGEVIDATNQVLTSVLEVNSILTAYLTRKKEE